MNGDYIEVYGKRWKTLDAAINAVRGLIVKDMQRENILRLMLDRLQAFGRGQYQHFANLLKAGVPAPSGYSQEFALRATLDQMAFDLQIIERTILERLPGADEIKGTLAQADEMALAALQPAIDAGYLPQEQNTTAITYFMKSASIRVLPYAPVALIGIPYTCANLTVQDDNGTSTSVGVTRDFLAIPHEVGHYVFWHGEMDNDDPDQPDVPKLSIAKQLRRRLKKKYPTFFPGWMRAWLEECFADIYGCLIAGPIIAVDFQDLELARSLHEFMSDDADHPLPAIRGELYVRTLQSKMNQAQWAEPLKKRWQELRDKKLTHSANNSPLEMFAPAIPCVNPEELKNNPASITKTVQTVQLTEEFAFSLILEELSDFIAQIRSSAKTPSAQPAIKHAAKKKGGKMNAAPVDGPIVNWWQSVFDDPKFVPIATQDSDELAQTLYARFDQFVQSMKEPILGTIGIETCDGYLHAKYGSQKSQNDLDQVFGALRTRFIAEYLATATSNLDSGEWFAILNAGGWTVEGPQFPQSGGP